MSRKDETLTSNKTTETDFLVTAFEFQLGPAENGNWSGYDFDHYYSECGTAHPTPRQHYATFIVQYSEEQEEEDTPITIANLTGMVYNQQDSNTSFGVFHATNEEEYETALLLLLPDTLFRMTHEKIVNKLLEHDLTISIVTGFGPQLKFNVLQERLSTRIELILQKSVVVAKCHISYRDDQWDPWIGPCIEAMSVHKEYRGKGYLHILWKQVIQYIRNIYNDDSDQQPQITIKVIHLLGSEIEVSQEQEEQQSIRDKDFYFDHLGFSVLPRGLLTGVMNFLRPMDDQGILLLLRKDDNHDDTNECCWTINNQKKGARNCQNCKRISKESFPCSGPCQGRVYYCRTSCQEADSKQHTRWCGLTREQVHEELVKEGRRVQDSKGEWRTVLE